MFVVIMIVNYYKWGVKILLYTSFTQFFIAEEIRHPFHMIPYFLSV